MAGGLIALLIYGAVVAGGFAFLLMMADAQDFVAGDEAKRRAAKGSPGGETARAARAQRTSEIAPHEERS